MFSKERGKIMLKGTLMVFYIFFKNTEQLVQILFC